MGDRTSAQGIETLVGEGNFDEAVRQIKKIKDKRERIRFCLESIMHIGYLKAEEEFGEVKVFEDRGAYERAKKGMDDCSPYAVLLIEGDRVHGLEEMTELVPEDNPLVVYFHSFSEEEQEEALGKD